MRYSNTESIGPELRILLGRIATGFCQGDFSNLPHEIAITRKSDALLSVTVARRRDDDQPLRLNSMALFSLCALFETEDIDVTGYEYKTECESGILEDDEGFELSVHNPSGVNFLTVEVEEYAVLYDRFKELVAV